MARKSSKTAHVMNLLAGNEADASKTEAAKENISARQTSDTTNTIKELTVLAQQASIQTQDSPLSPSPISIINMSSSVPDPVAERIKQQLEEEEKAEWDQMHSSEEGILQGMTLSPEPGQSDDLSAASTQTTASRTESSQAEVIQTAASQTEPVQPNFPQTESTQIEISQTEPMQTKTSQTKPTQIDISQEEPMQTKNAQEEPIQTASSQIESIQTASSQAKSEQATGSQTEALQTPLLQSNSAQGEPQPLLSQPTYQYLNIMEHVVNIKVEEYMQKFDVCTCGRCIADVKALALTHLPAKYIVVEPPAVSPLLNFYSNKFSQQVIVELTKACSIVKENPHH